MRELRRRVRPKLKLIGQFREPDDRPGHQLRVHRCEARVVDEASDRNGVAAVHIDHVAHRLKHREADAERQRHAQHRVEPECRQVEPLGQRGEVVGAEVVVLEEPEERQVRAERRDEYPASARLPAPAMDGMRRHVVDHRREHQQRHEQRIGPAVEDVADDRHDQVPPARRACVIKKESRWQEIEKEQVGGEDHGMAGLRPGATSA